MRLPVVLLSCLLAFSAFASNDREILLRTPPVTPDAQDEPDPTVRRARFVDVSLAPLRREAMRRNERKPETQLLSVTLFPEVTLDVKLTDVERTPIGSFAWTGIVEGDTRSSVTLAVHGNAIYGSIDAGGKRYAIEGTKHGLHRVTEIEDDGFPAELAPLGATRGLADAALVRAEDSESQIDVLVAYTATVRALLGSTAAAEALATSSIAATNTAYANSGVNPRVRLVGTVEVSHDEATEYGDALLQLRTNGDGQMDQVHPLRESLGADTVALLVHKPSACGVAYVMQSVSTSFAWSAFSVIDRSCAVSNLSFPHELGHNFGLAHDRLNSGGPASSNYSYGYQDPQGGFRDIMAYATGCGSPCPRIQYFSNPDLTYLNRPLGINYLLSNAADNRRALNENAYAVANFRQQVVPSPVTFTDDPLAGGATHIKALHITQLRTAINAKRAAAGLGAYAWSAAPASGGLIRAAHVSELRTALTPALAALGIAATYTDSTLTVNATHIKAVHIQELREYAR